MPSGGGPNSGGPLRRRGGAGPDVAARGAVVEEVGEGRMQCKQCIRRIFLGDVACLPLFVALLFQYLSAEGGEDGPPPRLRSELAGRAVVRGCAVIQDLLSVVKEVEDAAQEEAERRGELPLQQAKPPPSFLDEAAAILVHALLFLLGAGTRSDRFAPTLLWTGGLFLLFTAQAALHRLALLSSPPARFAASLHPLKVALALALLCVDAPAASASASAASADADGTPASFLCPRFSAFGIGFLLYRLLFVAEETTSKLVHAAAVGLHTCRPTVYSCVALFLRLALLPR